MPRRDGVRAAGIPAQRLCGRHRGQDRQREGRGSRAERKGQGGSRKAARPDLRPVPVWLLCDRRAGGQGLERRRSSDEEIIQTPSESSNVNVDLSGIIPYLLLIAALIMLIILRDFIKSLFKSRR